MPISGATLNLQIPSSLDSQRGEILHIRPQSLVHSYLGIFKKLLPLFLNVIYLFHFADICTDYAKAMLANLPAFSMSWAVTPVGMVVLVLAVFFTLLS